VGQSTQRDLAVPVTKSAAMRYLAEQVGHGYVLFQHGEVSSAGAVSLLEKFDDRHGVLASRGARDHARSRGRSCARLVVFPKDNDPETLYFWLLATEGDGPLPTAGNAQDARDPNTRLTWSDQYELVARPVRRRSGVLHHVWTWVFTKASYAGWQERLKKAAGRVRSSRDRKPDCLIEQVEFLRKVAGFQGINRQKRELVLGADIPAAFHASLNLRTLGSVVDKKLSVFVEGRTLRTLTAPAA
jgi:hypothetical protein